MKLCVDLGATNVKSGLVQNGKFVKTLVTPTDTTRKRQGVVASLQGAIDGLLCDEVKAICIASAGKIDVESGKVLYATENLPGYTGFCIKEFVRETYGLPCVAVNDGMAALLGEIYLTEEYRNKRIVMLTLGSGVGSAYAVNGEIQGKDDEFASFGHLCIEKQGLPCNCGKVGCPEQYLSGRAINRQAQEIHVAKNKLFDEKRSGNPKAQEVFDRLKGYLARTLQEIEKTSPFDICILGGGAVDGMGDTFDEFASISGCDVRRAKAGNNAGMLGAYYLGRDL